MSWLKWFTDPIGKTDDIDNDRLRVELQMHYDRIGTIEGLLHEDNQARAYILAEQLVKISREKRANQTLTETEKWFLAGFAPKERCNHLKGGQGWRFGWDKFRGATSPFNKDYNVMRHTNIDSSTYIKCLSCRKQWRPQDPDWQKAVEMLQQSTNTMTSSEQALHAVQAPKKKSKLLVAPKILRALARRNKKISR